MAGGRAGATVYQECILVCEGDRRERGTTYKEHVARLEQRVDQRERLVPRHDLLHQLGVRTRLLTRHPMRDAAEAVGAGEELHASVVNRVVIHRQNTRKH